MSKRGDREYLADIHMACKILLNIVLATISICLRVIEKPKTLSLGISKS